MARPIEFSYSRRARASLRLTQTFVAGADWKEYALPLSAFGGIDGHGVMALIFAGGPAPGPFAFRVDNIELSLNDRFRAFNPLDRLRRVRLLPPNDDLGWTPYAWLIYFPVFFIQPAIDGHARAIGGSVRSPTGAISSSRTSAAIGCAIGG